MKWVMIICIAFTFSCASTNNASPAKENMTYREIAVDLTTRLKSYAGVSVSGVQGRAKITIRGVSSIMDQSPLFMLDGRQVATYSDLYSMVNTSAIKRIEVLKNPVDLAMYGSRGANGVIHVITDPI